MDKLKRFEKIQGIWNEEIEALVDKFRKCYFKSDEEWDEFVEYTYEEGGRIG